MPPANRMLGLSEEMLRLMRDSLKPAEVSSTGYHVKDAEAKIEAEVEATKEQLNCPTTTVKAMDQTIKPASAAITTQQTQEKITSANNPILNLPKSMLDLMRNSLNPANTAITVSQKQNAEASASNRTPENTHQTVISADAAVTVIPKRDTEPSALITEPPALIAEPSALITEPSALITEPSALITNGKANHSRENLGVKRESLKLASSTQSENHTQNTEFVATNTHVDNVQDSSKPANDLATKHHTKHVDVSALTPSCKVTISANTRKRLRKFLRTINFPATEFQFQRADKKAHAQKVDADFVDEQPAPLPWGVGSWVTAHEAYMAKNATDVSKTTNPTTDDVRDFEPRGDVNTIENKNPNVEAKATKEIEENSSPTTKNQTQDLTITKVEPEPTATKQGPSQRDRRHKTAPLIVVPDRLRDLMRKSLSSATVSTTSKVTTTAADGVSPFTTTTSTCASPSSAVESKAGKANGDVKAPAIVVEVDGEGEGGKQVKIEAALRFEVDLKPKSNFGNLNLNEHESTNTVHTGSYKEPREDKVLVDKSCDAEADEAESPDDTAQEEPSEQQHGLQLQLPLPDPGPANLVTMPYEILVQIFVPVLTHPHPMPVTPRFEELHTMTRHVDYRVLHASKHLYHTLLPLYYKFNTFAISLSQINHYPSTHTFPYWPFQTGQTVAVTHIRTIILTARPLGNWGDAVTVLRGFAAGKKRAIAAAAAAGGKKGREEGGQGEAEGLRRVVFDLRYDGEVDIYSSYGEWEGEGNRHLLHHARRLLRPLNASRRPGTPKKHIPYTSIFPASPPPPRRLNGYDITRSFTTKPAQERNWQVHEAKKPLRNLVRRILGDEGVKVEVGAEGGWKEREKAGEGSVGERRVTGLVRGVWEGVKEGQGEKGVGGEDWEGEREM